MICSRRSTGCSEAEFCPECPVDHVRDAPLKFCKKDTSYVSRTGWPPLTGFNDDILDKTFSPHSQYLMADNIELIKIRDIHGGTITLKIVRKGQALDYHTLGSMK